MSYLSFPGVVLAATGPPAQGVASKTAVAVTGGPLSLFTVAGGEVRIIQFYGIVSTVIGGTVTTIRITNVVPGTDTDLCSAVAITNAAVGSLLDVPLTGAAMRVSTGQGAVLAAGSAFIVNDGTLSVTVASGGTTGAVDWYCVWQPLTAGATVVAV